MNENENENVNEEMETMCKFYFGIVMQILKNDDYLILHYCNALQYYIVQYPKILMLISHCEKEYYIIDDYLTNDINNKNLLKIYNTLKIIMSYIYDLEKVIRNTSLDISLIRNNNDHDPKFLLHSAIYDCFVKLKSIICNKINDKLFPFYYKYKNLSLFC